jgi:hypothetical protein
MPYEVIMNAENCDGHAVVKVGSMIPVDGGCHATHQEALDQMIALNIATADERSERNEQMVAAIDEAINLLLQAKMTYEADEEEDEDEPMDSSEMEDDEEYRAVNLVAPAFMRASAKRGLALHEQGESGDGLVPATVADARRMANGEALSENKWRKISPWIARHIVDLDAVQGDEITAGLVAMLLWGGGSSKASARRTQAYAERIVNQLENETRAPAPKKDQIKGSEKNPEGSAQGKTGGIVLNEATNKALENKVKEHNEKMKERNRPDWTRTSLGAVKSVYRRGAGAFSTSHRPGIGRAQWAMARVNAFLFLCRTGAPANSNYITDNDLLKPSHPKYSSSSENK